MLPWQHGSIEIEDSFRLNRLSQQFFVSRSLRAQLITIDIEQPTAFVSRTMHYGGEKQHVSSFFSVIPAHAPEKMDRRFWQHSYYMVFGGTLLR